MRLYTPYILLSSSSNSKREFRKKKRRKKKLNSLFPSRIPYGFANNHVIDTFSTDASAHSHIQEPTAITPHQIYSPPTSRHPALYHFLECPLPFSQREREKERTRIVPYWKGRETSLGRSWLNRGHGLWGPLLALLSGNK